MKIMKQLPSVVTYLIISIYVIGGIKVRDWPFSVTFQGGQTYRTKEILK